MGRRFRLCLALTAVGTASASATSLLQKSASVELSKSFLGVAEENAATSWRCVGNANNRTCLFKNLYYSRKAEGGAGDFVMFLPKGQAVPDIQVLRADKYEAPWVPRVQTFSDAKEISDYVASTALVEEPGLSVSFNPLFHQNIGHALFDGLYPAYMALVKLGLQDKNFQPVIGVSPGCFDPDSPAVQGSLKPGDIVEAYLPDQRYNRTLQTSHVEILQVTEDSSFLNSGSSDDKMLCNFEAGLDSSGMDLGGQPVPAGEAGQAECCKACSNTFGCKSGVIFANFCYLKGNCPGSSDNCDHVAADRQLCRFHQDRVQKSELTVRQISVDGPDKLIRPGKPGAGLIRRPGAGLNQAEDIAKQATISSTWVVDRVRRHCMSEGIFEKFGKSDRMMRLFEMDRDLTANQNVLFRFEEMVIGSGGNGNMVADESGAIGGSASGAMSDFRNRMLEAYDLPVDNGKASVDPNKPLDMIVVSNKRFSADDRAALDSVIKAVRKTGKVNAEFVDWRDIGTPGTKFREHLRRVQRADIYVSSIGTALQYVPFLKDQKAYIALGSVWQRDQQLFPTFMEQQLAGGGTPYLRTLYADPGRVLRKGPHEMIGQDGYFASVNASLLHELLGKAESLVRQGFQIPVPIEDNLSDAANVLLELCRRDPDTCKKMQADRNGANYECAAVVWPECVVYEVGPWRKKCNLNRSLLRQIRKERGLFSYGAPEM